LGRKWSKISEFMPGRIGKQCHERYVNHLDPALRKGGWTEQEDAILLEQHAKFYNKWAEIAKHLSGRSDNDVKNRWYQAHSSDAKEPPNYTRTAAQQFASYDMAEFQGDVLQGGSSHAGPEEMVTV